MPFVHNNGVRVKDTKQISITLDISQCWVTCSVKDTKQISITLDAYIVNQVCTKLGGGIQISENEYCSLAEPKESVNRV